MKKQLLFMCFALFITFSSYAQTVDIPDAVFKQYLVNNLDINTNGNDLIEESEASSFGAFIDIDSLGISDLTGLEAFTNLFSLSAKGNQFTSVDISKNARLNFLNISNNLLTELDVSNNLLLSTLYLANNQITSLDLSQNDELDRLIISENPIAELDINNLTELFLFYFDDTNISDIDLSNSIALEDLRCRRNGMTELDLSKNINLERLWIENNEFSELDLTNNPELFLLYMSFNKVSTLDLSQNPRLRNFYAFNNALTALDLSNNIALRELRLSGNLLEVLDLSNNVLLDFVFANVNKLKSLDVSLNPNLTGLYCTSNELEYLNIANGNNINMERMSAQTNPKLFCIKIDENIDLTNIPEGWTKDSQAEYNGDCCVASTAEINQTICAGESLITPGGLQITEAGTYIDMITNVGGCDSLITINVEVNTVDVSVNQDGNILNAIASDATYQWLDCNNDNAVIDDATTQTFAPEVNGSYAVLVSQNGCLDVSACFDIMSVGTNDFIESNLRIFPNPTHDNLRIDLGENYEDVVITISTATGQLVSRTNYNTINLVDIELTHSGIYFIEIQTAIGLLANAKVLKF